MLWILAAGTASSGREVEQDHLANHLKRIRHEIWPSFILLHGLNAWSQDKHLEKPWTHPDQKSWPGDHLRPAQNRIVRMMLFEHNIRVL